VVVQYNKPMFFDALAGFRTNKVHFHYPNHLNSCWGFTEDGAPECAYHQQQACSLTFAIANVVPSRIEPYFESIGAQAQRAAIVLDRHVALHSYPAGKMPSCGFISVSYFRFLNWVRSRQNRPRFGLIMIGFTGNYKPGTNWVGHDFAFEQQVYSTWLDLERLTADGTPMANR